MAQALDVVYKEDEHGKYVEFRMQNKKEYLCKIDLFDFDRIKFNNCYYIHRHVGPQRHLPYIRRAMYFQGKSYFTPLLHRELLMDDPADQDKYVVFLDGDSLNLRRHNLSLRFNSETHKACSRHHQTYLNYKLFGVKYISITWVEKKQAFQCYHKNKYICGGKTREISEARIQEYIALHKLKEANESETGVLDGQKVL